MHEILQLLLSGRTLSAVQTEEMMSTLISGGADDAQAGAMLGALRGRSETADELTGAARAILSYCTTIDCPDGAVDVCGTGADGSGSFNISTTVALVIAGAGVRVAKHGNRAVSSQCGSADVLEQLGVGVDTGGERASELLDQVGFAFLLAPAFHSALAAVGPLRRRIGVRTTFNVLGPLLNPARVRRQLVGVFDVRLLEPVALALRELGAEDAMVVASEDGLDELSISSSTHVVRVTAGVMQRFTVSPSDAGLPEAPRLELRGGDQQRNATITEGILNGDRGAPRDVVLLNSAAALVVAGRASSLREGVLIAADAIDSGRALAVLQRLRAETADVAA